MNSFFNFVTKYCSSLTDLYVNVGFDDSSVKQLSFGQTGLDSYMKESSRHLDELFQITTLRRVTIVDFVHLGYRPAKLPLCKDLRLLNIGCINTYDDFGLFLKVRARQLVSDLTLDRNCLIWKSCTCQKTHNMAQYLQRH